MAQAANLVIADGQATPVNQTFAVESATPALTSFAERSSGISVGYRRIKVSNSFASGKNVVNKSKLTIEVPITQTVSGIVSVAYTLRANVELILPDPSTDAQRKDLYAFLKNGLANALIQGAMRDYDPLY